MNSAASDAEMCPVSFHGTIQTASQKMGTSAPVWYEENMYYYVNKAEVFFSWGEHKYEASFFLYAVANIFWNAFSEK